MLSQTARNGNLVYTPRLTHIEAVENHNRPVALTDEDVQLSFDTPEGHPHQARSQQAQDAADQQLVATVAELLDQGEVAMER